MKGQKQSRTDLLEKKIDALIKVVQQLLDENAYLKDLSVGTLETIKLMDDYEDAIEKLRAKVAEELVRQKRLSPWKRLATRSGYMGSGFLIAAQWTIDPRLYVVGFILVVIQTASRKQIGNLVAMYTYLMGLLAMDKSL